jgi:hypothetical protein
MHHCWKSLFDYFRLFPMKKTDDISAQDKKANYRHDECSLNHTVNQCLKDLARFITSVFFRTSRWITPKTWPSCVTVAALFLRKKNEKCFQYALERTAYWSPRILLIWNKFLTIFSWVFFINRPTQNWHTNTTIEANTFHN